MKKAGREDITVLLTVELYCTQARVTSKLKVQELSWYTLESKH